MLHGAIVIKMLITFFFLSSLALAGPVSSVCWDQLSTYLTKQISAVSCIPPKNRSIPVTCQYYKVSELNSAQAALLEKWKQKTKQSIDVDQKLSQLFEIVVSLCGGEAALLSQSYASSSSVSLIHPRIARHPQKTEILKLILAINEPRPILELPYTQYKKECDEGDYRACTLQSLYDFRQGAEPEREKIIKQLNYLCDRGASLACIKNGFYSLERGLIGNAQVMYKKACLQLRGGFCTVSKEVQKIKDLEE
jgi:hypothetical protein